VRLVCSHGTSIFDLNGAAIGAGFYRPYFAEIIGDVCIRPWRKSMAPFNDKQKWDHSESDTQTWRLPERIHFAHIEICSRYGVSASGGLWSHDSPYRSGSAHC